MREGRLPLKRVTFSRSLADYITRQLGHDHQVKRLRFRVGEALPAGAESPTGLYAITSTRGSRATLRISLYREIADEFRDESRAIHVCIPTTLKETES